ncbi:hypothetical protein PT974_00979 [Cladobotryum mycophilum]|uniref:DUF427 domain-containing protein n=1 Tax=Cladobotryum mycophilum TaxID=491253 RepID=A0ABR0T2H6_9HYPO
MVGRSVDFKTGRAKATIDGTVLADTTSWAVVEGNVYFPPDSVKGDHLSRTELSTYCPWKGDASYYTIDVNGKTFDNAAWFYEKPFEKAVDIKDFVAFYKTKVDVTVE